MILHRVIDALLGWEGKYQWMEIPGVSEQRKLEFVSLLRKAMKFDFGTLMLEPDPQREGSHRVPELTTEELDFWRQGLIPLPFPICWYEFRLGEWGSGLLVIERDGDWFVERVDLVAGNEILFDGVIVQIRRSTPTVPKEWDIGISGNKFYLDQLERLDKKIDQNHFVSAIPLTVYLTLMLNSKSTESSWSEPSAKLNRRRTQRGTEPLAAHRVVTIVPERFTRDQAGEGGEGDRRSPRLHWRRSHLRHIEGKLPIVIARMLVGRADLGEVSHEYKIQLEKAT